MERTNHWRCHCLWVSPSTYRDCRGTSIPVHFSKLILELSASDAERIEATPTPLEELGLDKDEYGKAAILAVSVHAHWMSQRDNILKFYLI
jgi:hypothetical protein